MMSALSASRLRAVSLRVSPFLSEEASAEKLMTSAVRRWAASSKLMRVRVEGSTKRLTTVLPRRAGTFLMARSPTALKARAVSSTVRISSALSDWMSSRCFRFQAMLMVSRSVTSSAAAFLAEADVGSAPARRSGRFFRQNPP